jgi:hypothetical protein
MNDNKIKILLLKDDSAILLSSVQHKDLTIAEMYINRLASDIVNNWFIISDILFYRAVFSQQYLTDLFAEAVIAGCTFAIGDLIELKVKPNLNHLIMALEHQQTICLVAILIQEPALLNTFLEYISGQHAVKISEHLLTEILGSHEKETWLFLPSIQTIALKAAKNREIILVNYLVAKGVSIKLSSIQIMEILTRFSPKVLSLVFKLDHQVVTYKDCMLALPEPNFWQHIKVYLENRALDAEIIEKLAFTISSSQVLNFTKPMAKEELLMLAITHSKMEAIKLFLPSVKVSDDHLKEAFKVNQQNVLKILLQNDKKIENNELVLVEAKNHSWENVYTYLTLRNPSDNIKEMLWTMAFEQLAESGNNVETNFAYQVFVKLSAANPKLISSTNRILEDNDSKYENNTRYLLLNQFFKNKDLGGIQRLDKNFRAAIFDKAILHQDDERIKIVMDEEKPVDFLPQEARRMIHEANDPIILIQSIHSILEVAKKYLVYNDGGLSNFGCIWQGHAIAKRWITIISDAKCKVLALVEKNPPLAQANEQVIAKFLCSATGVFTSFFGSETSSGKKYKNLKALKDGECKNIKVAQSSV